MACYARLGVVLFWAALLSAQNHPAIVILIPTESVTASVAAGHLVRELDTRSRVESTSTLDPKELIDRARMAWPESVILV